MQLSPEMISRVRDHDHDRYLVGLFLPARDREALWTLLAWNYELSKVKEMVSEPMIGLIRLQWWREAPEEIRDGKVVRVHEVTQPLAALVREGRLSFEVMERMIAAREAELEGPVGISVVAMEQWLADTSGALWGLVGQALGVSVEEQGRLEKIGLAWGIVGVLRALPYRSEAYGGLPWKDVVEALARVRGLLLEAGMLKGAGGLRRLCLHYVRRVERHGVAARHPGLERAGVGGLWALWRGC